MHDSSKVSVAVGERLRDVRIAHGMSLRDVENESGRQLTAASVGMYERGERNLSLIRLYELAEFYDVPVAALLPADQKNDDEVGKLVAEIAAFIERRAQTIARKRGRRPERGRR